MWITSTAGPAASLELSLNIKSFLSAEDVVADYRAETKEQLLNELCARAAKAAQVDVQMVRGEILKREQLGCTGIGGGIAIPHARLQNLKKPFGSLVRLRKPIGYDAIDSDLVDIVFLLLLPTDSGGEQLNALAAVARKLRDQNTIDHVRKASDGPAMYREFIH
jgi:PTS system nitrogen regulatory IIA component